MSCPYAFRNFKHFEHFLIDAAKNDKGELDQRHIELFLKKIKKVCVIIDSVVKNHKLCSYNDELDCLFEVIVELQKRNVLSSKVNKYLEDLSNIKALSDKIVDQHRYDFFKDFSKLLENDTSGLCNEKSKELLELTIQRAVTYIEEAVTELKVSSH